MKIGVYVLVGAILFGVFQAFLSQKQANLNRDCAGSARDYFLKMKPPSQDSNDIDDPYSLKQSIFNTSLNTCVLEVTYGSSTFSWGREDYSSSSNDIIYDVYQNKQLATNEIDIYSKNEKLTSYCKTWVGNGPWINDTCENANKQFSDYKKSIGL